MPIPDYNEIKVPALHLLIDGRARKVSGIDDAMAERFQLSPEERAELLPSGVQRRWRNRVNWACYDLFRAGIFDRPKKGVYVITDVGRRVAEEKPAVLDREFLMRFEPFAQWMRKTELGSAERRDDVTSTGQTTAQLAARTPEEAMDAAHQLLNAALKKELLELVAKMDPVRFEQLVLDLLIAMGYGGSREEAAQVTKASNDEGIDGVINEDRLGLDVIYLQAKRWQQTVGRKEIQSFVGALAGQQAHKGVFITTSDFADTAVAYARKVPQKVILIDGDRLADLMIRHGIGVNTSRAYEVKHVDSDYFESD
jgi:restriction system protein